MSKLEELIQKLCPDGVEYKRVSDLCNVSRGIVISKQFIEGNKGDYPVYSSKTENNGVLGRINAYDMMVNILLGLQMGLMLVRYSIEMGNLV